MHIYLSYSFKKHIQLPFVHFCMITNAGRACLDQYVLADMLHLQHANKSWEITLLVVYNNSLNCAFNSLE